MYMYMLYIHTCTGAGAHSRGGSGGPGPPCDLKNTIFSGFVPLNYVIYIFEVCFFMLFCYVGGLRKPAVW